MRQIMHLGNSGRHAIEVGRGCYGCVFHGVVSTLMATSWYIISKTLVKPLLALYCMGYQVLDKPVEEEGFYEPAKQYNLANRQRPVETAGWQALSANCQYNPTHTRVLLIVVFVLRSKRPSLAGRHN